jgi:hypothetical protein
MTTLTTDEAALRLDVDPRHITFLCRTGALAAKRWGKKAWMVSAISVEKYSKNVHRRGGRPRPASRPRPVALPTA